MLFVLITLYFKSAVTKQVGALFPAVLIKSFVLTGYKESRFTLMKYLCHFNRRTML